MKRQFSAPTVNAIMKSILLAAAMSAPLHAQTGVVGGLFALSSCVNACYESRNDDAITRSICSDYCECVLTRDLQKLNDPSARSPFERAQVCWRRAAPQMFGSSYQPGPRDAFEAVECHAQSNASSLEWMQEMAHWQRMSAIINRMRLNPESDLHRPLPAGHRALVILVPAYKSSVHDILVRTQNEPSCPSGYNGKHYQLDVWIENDNPLDTNHLRRNVRYR